MGTDADHEMSLIENSIADDQPILRPERPCTPSETSGVGASEQQDARTPNEIFVDALSSPAPPTPGKEITPDETYNDAPLRKPVSQHETTLEYKNRVMVSNPLKQRDSQISYSLSEADEDSMLRLITRFDGPNLQDDHAGAEVDDDDEASESKSPPDNTSDSYTADIDQPEKMAALLSSTLGTHNAPPSSIIESKPSEVPGRNIKSPESETRPDMSVQSSKSSVDNTIPPSTIPESQVKDSLMDNVTLISSKLNAPRGSKTQFHEKASNKRTRKHAWTHEALATIGRKRNIIDKSAEVSSSQGADAGMLIMQHLGNTTILTKPLDFLAETRKLGVDRRESTISSPPEEGQISPTDRDIQMPDAGDLTSDCNEFRMSSADKLKDIQPLEIHNDTTKEKSVSRKGNGTYEGRSESVDNRSESTSRQEVGVERAGISDKPQSTGLQVISKFEEMLASLRSVALKRDEAEKLENLLWDVKGELYAAEKRGREAT
jgi:hypothetical protein